MSTGGTAHVERPRFTILTTSFNQGAFLEATIRSVAEQGRHDVEHIVLDGGSTDASVAILRAHDASLAYWTSAPDAGQPAALNAGLRRARGEIVAFLNSDDLYLPGALDHIAHLADAYPGADWFVAGTIYFGEGSGDIRHEGKAPSSASDVLFFDAYAPQPGHFWRRSVFERVGHFDEALDYGFDFDFMARCALARVQAVASSRPVAAFRFHDASKTMAARDRQHRDTDIVQERWFEAAMLLDGQHRAKRARARFHGHLALGAARDARRAGRTAAAWRLFAAAMRRYPTMIATRAFGGTVQRLLGLRSD